MAKTDVKSAFRIIPIHPADFSLLGMKWDNMYYFDRCLAMGLSSSCAIFESFSTALEWLSINHLSACAVVHILEDFLFIAKSKEKCVGDLQNFITMCNHLGVPLAPKKTVGPATVLQFAGITSVRQEARLPEDKIQKCRAMLHDFQARRLVYLRELQSLKGLLNFTCLVFVPGRAFLRPMIDPIVIAVHIWESLMAHKRVMFFSDNAAVVDVINNQTSKHRGIMILLRDLVLSCLRHNILFRARHIPGLINSRADYISRSQVAKFKVLSPEADQLPTPAPENLMPRSWVLTKDSAKLIPHY